MLKIKDCNYRYDQHHTFQLDVKSMHFTENETIGIIGPNGSGKSTLLKLIARQLEYKKLEIICQGTKISNVSPAQYSKYISYLPQRIQLNGRFKVEELLLQGRYAHNPTLRLTKDEQSIIDHYLDIFDLRQHKNTPLQNLSGGQQKIAVLASVFVQQTPVIILDEPFNALDIPHQYELIKIIKKCKDTRQTVLFSSHNLDLVMKHTNRVVAIDHGAVQEPFAVEKFSEKLDLLSRIFGQTISIDHGSETNTPFLVYHS